MKIKRVIHLVIPTTALIQLIMLHTSMISTSCFKNPNRIMFGNMKRMPLLSFSTKTRNIPKWRAIQMINNHQTMKRSFISLNLFPSCAKIPYTQHKMRTFSRLQYTNNRFFGSKGGSNNETNQAKGAIIILDEQKTHPTLHESIPHINRVLEHIRNIIGYPTYEIVLVLVDNPEIQELNLEYLGNDRPTDILSFPFDDDVIVEPGVLCDPIFDIEDFYSLGDIYISIPYVMKRAEDDMKNIEDEEEDTERGISGIMATMETVEERIPALLIHGMLHLVGYDHIEDKDYYFMVEKEEEVWKELNRRLEEDKKK